MEEKGVDIFLVTYLDFFIHMLHIQCDNLFPNQCNIFEVI